MNYVTHPIASDLPPYIAFEGHHRIASGDLSEVAAKTKPRMDVARGLPILIFDHLSRPVEIDFRGTIDEVLSRLPAQTFSSDPTPSAEKRGPGRPKLGVVAREVTLLPRHWDWLNQQPGGASVAIRKLVEAARRSDHGETTVREAEEALYKFISVMAGNLPGYEEALRAFYAGRDDDFQRLIKSWPVGIRQHLNQLLQHARNLRGPSAQENRRDS